MNTKTRPLAALPAMTPTPYTVVSRKREADDVYTLTLVPAADHKISSPAPGQFNMLYAFGVGEAAISASRLSSDKRLIHTIRRHGAISTALAALKTGGMLGVRGPYGVGWPSPPQDHDVIVVAGGLGIAPLRPFIDNLATDEARTGRVVVIFGARAPSALIYGPDFKRWRTKPGVDVHVTVDVADANWNGPVGLVAAPLRRLDLDPGRTSAFVCGPEIMMRHVGEALTGRGVAGNRIFLSLERNMKCAIGHCGHCQLGPAFVCKDGPVFSFDRIRDALLTREL